MRCRSQLWSLPHELLLTLLHSGVQVVWVSDCVTNHTTMTSYLAAATSWTVFHRGGG
jgi:hypothetical protein